MHRLVVAYNSQLILLQCVPWSENVHKIYFSALTQNGAVFSFKQ